MRKKNQTTYVSFLFFLTHCYHFEGSRPGICEPPSHVNVADLMVYTVSVVMKVCLLVFFSTCLHRCKIRQKLKMQQKEKKELIFGSFFVCSPPSPLLPHHHTDGPKLPSIIQCTAMPVHPRLHPWCYTTHTHIQGGSASSLGRTPVSLAQIGSVWFSMEQ